MERTGEFNKMAHLVDAAEKDVPPEESVEVAHYIRENLGVRFRVNENGRVEYLMLGGMIPAADLIQRTIGPLEQGKLITPSAVVKNIVSNFMQGMNPLLKVPIENPATGFNWSFYFNRPIERYEGELGEMFGQVVPRRYLHLIQNVRFVNDFSKFFKVVQGMSGGVSQTRPDIPLPDTGMEASRDLLGLLGGVKLLENANPDAQRFFQQLLPRRDAKKIFQREARRGSANVAPAQRNFLKTLGMTDEQIDEIQANQ